MPAHPDELQAIADRYARREQGGLQGLYDPIDPYVTMSRQERERAWIRGIRHAGLAPVAKRRVLEIGCGRGNNLIELIRLGFTPGNLVGNELNAERLDDARERLPRGVTLIEGDAATLDLEDASFDVVLQSTVFTSILDESFQKTLADRMWALARPGGGILWYDFTWDNPRNPDVRGMPLRRIGRLFPKARIRAWRVTLAPPLGRRLGRSAPILYPLLNAFPFLRTHLLCWIPRSPAT